MSDRAVPHVRKFLGQRLRELRKQRGLSQGRLGDGASLSGKFISEVERGEKSISVDSLYKVSVALAVPLGPLTDVRPGQRGRPVSGRREDLRARLGPAATGRRTQGLRGAPRDAFNAKSAIRELRPVERGCR
jgi:transcriptional regulator with XRE-family HTH domain